MNNPVFGKTMEHVRKHRAIKHVTTERERHYFVSEPNYQTESFAELSKILMYQFWYDYVK